MTEFKILSDFIPRGHQPNAIKKLSASIKKGQPRNVLLGVTGSGKTFTMAHVIAEVQKPSLIIAPNKTLAAQLYNEFKLIFPENAVEYFVSYYDYYQPEAYIPASDTYIQKDSSINEMIDKLRHSATKSVLSRKDVIVVASVSCIFGLGAPEDYLSMRVDLKKDMKVNRDKILLDLIAMHYERNDFDFHRGVFRVRGDRVEIFPAYEEDKAIRLDFFGDEIEGISEIDPLKGQAIRFLKHISIFPASHYVTQKNKLKRAVRSIVSELKERLNYFYSEKKLIEAQRIDERTRYDLEMIQELGYCNGIENYSRHLTGREKGDPSPTLLDYFNKNYMVFIDESHITVPQLKAMFKGDRSRKETLVQYGFRLPSALDNRPLRFDEIEERIKQAVYVSATPSDYELESIGSAPVELIVRPTGLIDPKIEVRPADNQVDDLLGHLTECIKKKQRVLVTTLTKRMAEDLTEYYSDLGIKIRYLHSDINTLERMDIITDLRLGRFDVLVGINLLREGLDIPEVSLVAILDADKEGFLRSARSLIQTCGRASRNVEGHVIMYANTLTPSMKKSIQETERRRKIQKMYNQRKGITPETIKKDILPLFESVHPSEDKAPTGVSETAAVYKSIHDLDKEIETMQDEMNQAASELQFEKAAKLRDEIIRLKKMAIFEF